MNKLGMKLKWSTTDLNLEIFLAILTFQFSNLNGIVNVGLINLNASKAQKLINLGTNNVYCEFQLWLILLAF